MDIQTLNRRRCIWEDALLLPGTNNLVDSGIKELSRYFSKSYTEVDTLLSKSSQVFAELWREKNINPKDEKAVISFYSSTNLEIFELMDWHINRIETGPLNYVSAMETAKKLGLKRYLDYGSGIGSGMIVFLTNGFDVTCADVSKPLLDFVKFRLQVRNLEATLIDLKTQMLDKESYDIITCFDVLEHAVNPSKILDDLRAALTKDGFLIINNLECSEDKTKPMHISQVNLEKKLRYRGFNQLWGVQNEFKKSCSNYTTVLKKIRRSFLTNSLFYLYDNFCPIWLSKFIKVIMGKYYVN